jgi:hypothetical protein
MPRFGQQVTAVLAALVVFMTAVTPTSAVTWDTGPFLVSGAGGASAWSASAAFPADTMGHTRVGLAYREDVGGVFRVFYRNSSGGEEWDSPRQLSRSGAVAASRPSLAWAGSKVDAVWVEWAADNTSRVVYRRSLDGGLTWSKAVALSPLGTSVGFPKVARDGAGRVLVAYTNEMSGKVWVRVSTDGGVTFGKRLRIGTTSSRPYQGDTAFDAFPTVATARGVLHIAFYRSANELVMRRSDDFGASWSSRRTVTSAGDGYFPHLVASGRTVLVGYAARSTSSWYTAYRRSIDNGATWSREKLITSKTGNASGPPVITAVAGIWTIAYEQCQSGSCGTSVVKTQTSWDGGAGFEGATKASHVGVTYAWPLGSAFAGNWVTLYATYTNSSGAEQVWSMLGG